MRTDSTIADWGRWRRRVSIGMPLVLAGGMTALLCSCDAPTSEPEPTSLPVPPPAAVLEHHEDEAADTSIRETPSEGVRDEWALIYEPEIIEDAGSEQAHAVVEQSIRFATSEDYRLSPGEPTMEELRVRAAQVEYEADRRLQMLSEKYQLTEEQEALAFPIIARASQAYHPALQIEGEAATEAYLDAVQSTLETPPSSAETLTPAAHTPDDVPDEDVPLDEAFQAAIDSSLDAVEEQLALFLDEEQLALLTEEQIDRYYWWGELLLVITGDLESGDDSAAAAEEPDPEPENSSSPEPGEGTQPVAHQGGNLFDLF